MPDIPNNPLNFWLELKRRKVVRVITVYAAAAFVIIELINNVYEPLKLPEWTPALVIVLLIIGFIITVILSWIYDIHPEGGIVKTEPAHKVKIEEIPKSSKSWKIATYISAVVIIGLIIFNIFGRRGKVEDLIILDKSIAVLPFHNDSPDEENEYFINGTMEAILDNLCKIKDLRVVGRTSVEQYRNNPKPIPEIAKEMNVSYILEGSGQKYGNNVRLTLQLLDARNDKHLWSSPYNREILMEQIFNLQSEIAELVAEEIKSVITPEEKLLIDNVPTTSLTAYDFYQRGKEEYLKYDLDNYNRDALERAEDLFYKALKYDSTFAQAYTGLAIVYREKNVWKEFLNEHFLDSVLILADIALSFNDQLSEAYYIRGDYYRRNNNKDQAIMEFDRAIRLNPNEYRAYFGKAEIYFRDDDLVKTLENVYRAASLNRGPSLPKLYGTISFVYGINFFRERSIYYAKEALKLDDDSAKYYFRLAMIEETNSNFEKAIEFYKKAYAIDSTLSECIFKLAVIHSYLGINEEYLEYFKEYYKRLETLDRSNPSRIFRLGHAFWVNGFKEEAENYFNEGLRYHNEMLELDRYFMADYITFYNLAAAYAFSGDKDKAYENLRLMNQRPRMPKWMIKDLSNDPLFESIRDEPEFQQIVQDVEAKYQAEHERVRQWLEENNML